LLCLQSLKINLVAQIQSDESISELMMHFSWT